MQRASAGFALYQIYQDMFRGGRVSRLMHAVVFDAAPRAGKLNCSRLLPRNAASMGWLL